MDSLGSLNPYRLEGLKDRLLSTAKLSGPARPLLTTLPQFVTLLAHSGLNGPHHLHAYSLDNRGEVVSEGAQFTVFTDRARLLDKVVMKRVKGELIDTNTTPSILDDQRKRHLRTLELEILALCDQSLRDHPNIVNVHSWGFDYPTRDLKSAIPVLFVEKAKCSLRSLLKQEPSLEVRHQLISDIAAGLACLHGTEIVHGDLKPDNVLIFEQPNLSVPYIAKLNDFGMCIPLEDKSSVSYQSYGGTPGWLAPEVREAERGKLENLSDVRLLLKCDIFTFGLLALSIFITSGEPPFGQLETISTDSYLQAGSQLVKKASVALSSSVTNIIEKLVLATLNADPSQRFSVDQISLADDSPGYISWLSVHRGLTLHNPNGLKYRDRPIYWRTISAPVLEDLEKLITPNFRPDMQQVLAGEVLFGMAASVVSARQPGFQEKYAQYIQYAAHAGSVAAQGIVGRLLEARSATSAEDDQVRLSWLETAVSTGSLVAAEDLQKLDAGLLEVSRKKFRDKGGYNSESHDSHGPWENQQVNPFALTVQSASALCDSLKTPDGRCYRKSNTMLHFAAMHGNCSVISYLVQERGTSIDTQNDAGETPLYKACLSANLDAVRNLIGFRASATIPAEATGASCLHWLFNFEADEMREVAELLIRQGGGDVNAEVVPPIARGERLPIAFEHFPFHWPFGTPLHWAVAVRSKHAVETLLHFQCDINAPDISGAENGQTALTMAMYRADSEMSEMLVTNGAKVDKIDAKGRNIIHILAADHTHMNRAFPLPRSVWSWVTHGSSQSHLNQLRRCLAVAQDLGLDLNAVRRKCQTPLIDAIENSDACTMVVLLDAGADANVINPMGEAALHEWLVKDGRDLAYSELYLPVTERLVSLTKDLNRRDELYLESVIHRVAITKGDQEQFEASLQMLLAKDPPADINTQDRYGRTPFLKLLGSSCAGEIAQRTATFIQVHADVLLKDNDGKGFLFVLCENESLSDHETFSILTSILERFSKPERQVVARTSGLPEQGPNALTPAIRQAKFLCVKLLVKLGVDIDALDAKRRWTPLDCAIAIGDSYRAMIIEKLFDSIGPADRMDALEDGTAFTTNFLETGGIGTGTNAVTREQYFNAPDIISYLETVSAKRAKDIIDDPGEISNPFLTDYELLEASRGFELLEAPQCVWDEKQILRQPFLSHWVRIYEIAWEEHKGANHSACQCCQIFSKLPRQLRRSPFTTKLLREYLELRPSVDVVKDLMSER